MFQTLRLAEFFVVHQVPGVIIGKIAYSMLFSLSLYVIPISFLAAVFFGTGRLSSESELVALKASGVSHDRMVVPVLGLATLVSILTLVCSMELAPYGERTTTRALYMAGMKKVLSAVKAKTFTQFFDLILYAEDADEATGMLTNVLLFDERNAGNPMTVLGQSGQIVTVKADNEFSTRLVLKLFNGSTHRKPEVSGQYQRLRFKEYSVYLSADLSEIPDPTVPRAQSLETLLAGFDNPIYQIEFWKRIALSVSPIFFCFTGLGLGSIRTRSSRSLGVLLTLASAILFWEALAMGTILSPGTFRPAIGMQIPNVLNFTIALIAYIKAKRW